MRDNDTAHTGADDGRGDGGAAHGDVLGTPDLLALDGVVPKGGGQPVHDRIGGVSLGRPLAYALRNQARRPATADPDREFLVCFPFDLEELPDGRRYEQVTLTVHLADGMHALSLDPAPGTVAADGTEISVFGLGRQRLRWTFRAPGRGGALRPDGRWAQAVVRMPASSADVSGRVSLSTTTVQPVLGGALRRRAAQTPYDTPFRVRAAEAWPAVTPLMHQGAFPGAWALATYEDRMRESDGPEPDDERLPPGLRRLCLAVDIEKYSARDNADMVRLQRVLLRTLRAACERVGVVWERCGRQAQGDGYLLVLEPDVDETRVVPGLLDGLTAGLAAANERATEANSVAGQESSPGDLGSVRMRASLHQGIVHEADSGYAGSAVVALFRVLDSDPVRRVLAESPGTDLVAAFSDTLYQDLVDTGYEGLSAVGFEKVEIEIAAKNFTAVAWVRAMRSAGEG
ncbi:hypothetical protein [Streptomyces liliifuscus]|uniref:Guanylate cyclase domain-containing protein n=1 Tax=Streptomyces liliifuscus TaxID=2797636 RepID=A0A7T7I668_9ACTN|nr:hypothetical protein [Streptomyces liliifuscus]QQM41517.1 hypothetical protein JEQ17_19990 [Streptomyces liliifuscus]